MEEPKWLYAIVRDHEGHRWRRGRKWWYCQGPRPPHELVRTWDELAKEFGPLEWDEEPMALNETDYPEHLKMAKIKDASQAIGEFLDWLQGDGVVLSRWQVIENVFDEDDQLLLPIHDSIESLLAKYFDIDLTKIDSEKRALLDHIRAMNESETP